MCGLFTRLRDPRLLRDDLPIGVVRPFVALAWALRSGSSPLTRRD
jgi:hypothetical protein